MPSGLILQPTYRVRGGAPVIQLFGRLEEGPAFLVEEHRFRPYFFVPEGGAAAIAGERGVGIQPTPLRDLGGAALERVEAPTPNAVPPLREGLARAGVRALEADVRFAYRFLIDRGERSENGDRASAASEGNGGRLLTIGLLPFNLSRKQSPDKIRERPVLPFTEPVNIFVKFFTVDNNGSESFEAVFLLHRKNQLFYNMCFFQLVYVDFSHILLKSVGKIFIAVSFCWKLTTNAKPPQGPEKKSKKSTPHPNVRFLASGYLAGRRWGRDSPSLTIGRDYFPATIVQLTDDDHVTP